MFRFFEFRFQGLDRFRLALDWGPGGREMGRDCDLVEGEAPCGEHRRCPGTRVVHAGVPR